MISSRGVGDVFATLDAIMFRISDGKVVMFTPLVLQLSIPTRRDAERRWHVSQEKRCQCRGCHEVILVGTLIEVGIADVGIE
jgi:hypothetical protein